MTDKIKRPDPALIARRYAAERRFRIYGIIALTLTTAFLAVLLTDIISRSIPAFTQYHAVLDVTVDPEAVDAAKPSAGDFEGLAKAAWRAQADRFVAEMDLVRRDEFDVLTDEIAALRAEIAALKSAQTPASKPRKGTSTGGTPPEDAGG